MKRRVQAIEATRGTTSGIFTDGRAVRAAINRVGCKSMRPVNTSQMVAVPAQNFDDVCLALELAGQRVDIVMGLRL